MKSPLVAVFSVFRRILARVRNQTVINHSLPLCGVSGRSRYKLAHFFAAGLVAVLLWPVTSSAAHTVITSEDADYGPYPDGNSWNGLKVYLSSPRHANSGRKDECGWEENINGRYFNWYAATGWFYKEEENHTSQWRNLRARGYQVTVGANSRDDGWRINRKSANNWGADVQIVTHTNGNGTCPDSAQYLLIMFQTGNNLSEALRDQLEVWLDPIVPGGFNTWGVECCSDEINDLSQVTHKAYVELFFHTNQNAVDWFQAGGGIGEGRKYAWRYGLAIDKHLGYPR